MNNFVAERRLFYSEKNSVTRKSLVVGISHPKIVESSGVGFPVNGVIATCRVELIGLDQYSFDVYGMDSLQVINMASNIESLLERLSHEYDFYWSTGEPYFEDK